MSEEKRRLASFRAARYGFRRGLLAAVLLSCAATAGAQGDGFRMEAFGGLGAVVADEPLYTFDMGATAWLTQRWGLGVWSAFPRLVGEEGTGLLLSPAIRYQHRLRRGRSLHVGAGLGHVIKQARHQAEFSRLPYADILYGVPAANRKFGMRAGVRFVGPGLHLVLLGSFTSD